MTTPRPKPLILIVLDGFGVSTETEGNPVASARKPTFEMLERDYPFATLQASGTAVGLPWGEAGNSEVGHLTIGAGKAFYHHLPRIINSIYDGSFFQNEALLKAAEHVKKNNSALHLTGLVSSGSVHSYVDHLYALLEFAKKENLEKVFLHVWTDGKDAPPNEAAKFIGMLEERIGKESPGVKIATVVGRFYAMDRDEKWERTRAAYELMAEGKGEKIASVPEYLKASYEKGTGDEFIEPAVITKENPSTDSTPSTSSGTKFIQDNDALIFFNFREDSMRQIARAFAEEGFDKFPKKNLKNLAVATMTEYMKGLNTLVAFPPIESGVPLSKAIGEAGLRHLHIAESLKYAHVTYFLNGGRETPFAGEERILVQSLPGHPAENPEMKASEITERVSENLGRYDVIIANLANADLVGHSGDFQAAVASVEILDESLAKLIGEVLKTDGVLIVTADHGNIELKRDAISGEKLTEHSLNPVPLWIVGKKFKLPAPRGEFEIAKIKSEAGGILTDVAPTVLKLLGIKKPAEMTGKSLLETLSSKL